LSTIIGGYEIITGKGGQNEMLDLLKSTIIEKGRLYHFDYKKSVVIDENFPDADFWRTFAQEEDLMLPVGVYTISLTGEFGFTENVISCPSGLACELEIEVVN